MHNDQTDSKTQRALICYWSELNNRIKQVTQLEDFIHWKHRQIKLGGILGYKIKDSKLTQRRYDRPNHRRTKAPTVQVTMKQRPTKQQK
ncbi:hypothetical protein ACIMS1_004401 [Vibrio harveyi]